MTHNELLALLQRLETRITLAKETLPICGCSTGAVERRREASGYLQEAEILAKEIHDEVELQHGERLVRMTGL
jgi:hypothetical protein